MESLWFFLIKNQEHFSKEKPKDKWSNGQSYGEESIRKSAMIREREEEDENKRNKSKVLPVWIEKRFKEKWMRPKKRDLLREKKSLEKLKKDKKRKKAKSELDLKFIRY